jgi:hypothetical protein
VHQFDKDLSLKETSPYCLRGELSDTWSHIGVINGGFQLALLYKAMSAYARKPEGLIMTGNYIAKCSPGPVEINVKPISSSRNFDRFEVRLSQRGREKLRAFGTFAGRGGPASDLGTRMHKETLAPIDQCIRVDSGGRTKLFDNIDIFLDPVCTGWVSGDLIPEAIQRGWIQFHQPRNFDIPAVIMTADSFPPSVYSLAGRQKMVPTIEYSIQLSSVPPVDTLGCLFRSPYLTGEIITEEGVVRTPDGKLVAVSHQTALFRE